MRCPVNTEGPLRKPEACFTLGRLHKLVDEFTKRWVDGAVITGQGMFILIAVSHGIS